MKNNQNLASLPSEWIMKQAGGWPKGSRILDFAAGHGRHSVSLSILYPNFFDILAVDHDQSALAILKRNSPNVKVCCADIENTNEWPFAPQDFDVVIVTNYLHRPRLNMLFNLISKDGYLAYETFAAGNEVYGRPSNPHYLLNEGELLKILPNNFTVIDYFHGKVEKPKPAIIQRIAARRYNI